MLRTGLLRGLAGLALGTMAACAPPPETASALPGTDASRRISECGFRVVLRTGTLWPDSSADAVLETAAAIARRTRFVFVNGTYAPEEAVNDFRALEAVAMRHGGAVRDLLVARGVPPEAIRLNGLVSHPSASRSGAYVRVCAPGRNVENGWRERPVDPGLVVRMRLNGPADAPVLHVPIVNLSPYVWNDVPIRESTIPELQLDRADDPATFMDAQSRCGPRNEGPGCARRVSVSLRPWTQPAEFSRGERPGRFVPVTRRVSEGSQGARRVQMTRRWAADATSLAQIDCGPYARLTVLPGAVGADSPWACSANLSIGVARLQAFVSFFAADEPEALAIVDRARRDLIRFARTDPP